MHTVAASSTTTDWVVNVEDIIFKNTDYIIKLLPEYAEEILAKK